MGEHGHAVIVGGGIAGVSAAYFLAMRQVFDHITLLEAESQLAHHTTGRSAALLTENYGTGSVRPLTAASLDFLHSPPAHLIDAPLLHSRGIMTIATGPDGYPALDRQLDEGSSAKNAIVEISADKAATLAPHIRVGPDHRAMWEAHAHDIDVAALHQAYVRGFRALGGEIATARRVDAARRDGAGWQIETTTDPLTADVIINAAGAWGDVVAEGAGMAAVGLEPKRRTAFMVTSPFEASADFPFVADADHTWYLRPDGQQFMCSPADEIPSEPCDAKAEEVDVALTIDRLNTHTTLNIRAVNATWAGLRTFAPDRAMVIGPDPAHPNFVWCVGQGGTGIQTSPGAGQLVADLIVDGAPGARFDDTGLDLDALLPDRLLRDLR